LRFKPFQDLSRSRIDAPQIALVTFPGAVPELPVDPGDPGDEAVGLDRAKNRPYAAETEKAVAALASERSRIAAVTLPPIPAR
jgi:hypothetical protein